ncbi:MAG: protein prkA, partial [Desulfitobacterium sp.]|nr:protein prkA [Desulfitobacterium sp.]
MEIIEWLKSYREREAALAWQGTFAEYLPMVIENPSLAIHAHGRIYEIIRRAGIIKNEDGTKTYQFFTQELFGLEKTLERLVEEYFHSAAKRLDVRKRILLLMGPVSGGKSTIVTMLKKGLEEFTTTDEGAVY